MMPGITISHYKIIEKLGESSTGVVYKAEDAALQRIVALKLVSRQAFNNEDEKARFVHDAKIAATLEHPNICTVYEVNEINELGGQVFIAMEYIEGESLAQTIATGPLSIKDAVNIAIQIAQGLHAAHAKNIIHYAVKSSNIVLTGNNQVKLMGLGLSKKISGDSISETELTSGSLAYMSPEQVRNEDVDHRTDIWALGVLLYEMVAGHMPFKGEYDQTAIYWILNLDPVPLTAVRTGAPDALDAILAKLLTKVPEDRYQDTHQLQEDLSAIDFSTTSAKKASDAGRLHWKEHLLPFVVTGAICALMAGLASVWLLKLDAPASQQPVKRTVIELPVPQSPGGGIRNNLTLSQDGRYLAYIAGGTEREQLYLRPLDKFETFSLPLTAGAEDPFFSPDGDWIGFFNNGLLMRVSTVGGTALKVCEFDRPRGGTWGPGNTIIVGTRYHGLYSVSIADKIPVPITTIDQTAGELSHCWPHLLPDGETVLFTIAIQQNNRIVQRIAALNLNTNERTILLEDEGTMPHYLPSGHLVYSQGSTLMAVRLNLQQLKVQGSPIPVLDNISEIFGIRGGARFSLSREGTLVYYSSGSMQTNHANLVMVNRAGDITQQWAEPKNYTWPRFSPDGNQVAVGIRERAQQNVWVYDVQRGTLTRMTLSGDSAAPIWTPDGKRLTYRALRDGKFALVSKEYAGNGPEETLLENQYLPHTGSWSPDMQSLVYYDVNNSQRDIYKISRQGSDPSPLVATSFNERAPRLSHDGRWLAYVSDKTGTDEVYVRTYPNPGPEWQISNKGGAEPVWSADGRELYYRNGYKMMAVTIQREPDFKPIGEEVLFEKNFLTSRNSPMYDVHPDGTHFLMVQPDKVYTDHRIHVVLNWLEEIDQKISQVE
jgi:serine/threonine protein kinase